jgi:membrane-bound metal-dependent hydrolase YbcI (DUF457 family)
MPLPLAHAAIGLATHEVSGKDQFVYNPWKRLAFVVALANLPDLDILAGLVLRGDGGVFHRGPTHSLFFAVLMGWVAARAWRYWSRESSLSVLCCVLIILSHVLADAVFTSSPVSFLWPFEVHWSSSQCGWLDVIDSLFVGTLSDIPLVLASGAVIVCSRLLRYRVLPHLQRHPVRVQSPSHPKGSRS